MATKSEEVLLRVGMDHSGISRGVMEVKHAVKDGFKDLGKDILAGFSFGAVISKMEGVFEQVDRINSAASKTGFDPEMWQKLSTVAGQDLPEGAEKLEGAMTKLNVKIGEGGKELEKWGIHSKNAQDAMFEIADKMAQMTDPAQKAAMAVDLMGKSGADMVPLLERGAKALKEMADSKGAWTKEEIEQIKDAKEGMETIQNRVTIWTGRIISTISNAAQGLGRLSTGPTTLAKDNIERTFFKAKETAKEIHAAEKSTADVKAASDKFHDEFAKRALEQQREMVRLEKERNNLVRERNAARHSLAMIDVEKPTIEQLAGRGNLAQINAMFGEGGQFDLGGGTGPGAMAASNALFWKNKQMFDVIQGNAKFNDKGELVGGAAFQDRSNRMAYENQLKRFGLETPEMLQKELNSKIQTLNNDIRDLLQAATVKGIKLDPNQ